MPTLYNSKTRKAEELDGDDLAMALATGTHSYAQGEQIPVMSPDGSRGFIPSENVQKAIASGFNVETPSQRAIREYVEANKGIKGTLKVGLGQLADEAALGLPELIFDKTADPLEVAKKEALKKEHDLANTLGGVGGFGVSLFTGGPLFKVGSKAGEKVAAHIAEKIIAKGGGEVGKRTAMQAAREITGNLAGKAAGGAVEGAILAMPHAITETALGDPEAAAETLLMSVGIGSLFGAGTVAAKELFKLGKAGADIAVTGGKKAVTAADETARVAARKIAKTLTGVNEDDILHYVQNVDRVNQVGSTYTVEGLKDEIDNAYLKMQERVSVAKENERRAFEELEGAYAVEKQRLGQTRAPETMVADLLGEQQNLKATLGGYSDELYDALDRVGGEIDVPRMKSFVAGQMNALKVGDKAILGETAKKEFARLSALQQDLDMLPEKLSMTEAKQIIKQMDPDLNFQMGAGEFNEISQRNGKEFRKFINDQIRGSSDEVAGILNKMSDISDVLARVNKKFGTPEKAVANINNIFTPKGKLNKELLEELSSVSGKDFISPLREFETAKSLIDKSKVKDIRDEIVPELSAQYKKMKAELDDATTTFDPVKRLNQNRTQAIIRNQGFKNASIEDRRALETLSQMNGKDFNQLIQDLNTFKAFEKESITGSRKTLLFSTLGGAIGGAIGGPAGALAGSSAGAGVGAVTDVYGGHLLKKIIDGTPNVSGILFAEKQMKNLSNKLDDLGGMLSRLSNGKQVKTQTASLEALLRLLDGDTKAKPETNATNINNRMKKLEELNEKASQLVGNPDEAARRLAALTAPLSEGGAPMIAASLNDKANQAFQYIFAEMPKPSAPRNVFAPQIKWRPSDTELSAFEQKVSVVLDPLTVLKELENGTITKNHIDALKKVYPKMHEVLKDRIYKEAAKSPKPLDYAGRVKLSLLMDEPLDRTLTGKSILDYQKTFLPPEQSGLNQEGLTKMKVAQDSASDVQKVLS